MQNLEELCTLLNLPDYVSAQAFLMLKTILKLDEQLKDSEAPTWRNDVRAMIIQDRSESRSMRTMLVHCSGNLNLRIQYKYKNKMSETMNSSNLL